MRLRIYVDTSVIGGCYDAEFERESTRFFDLVRAGRVLVLISDLIVEELWDAPQIVQELLPSLPAGAVARVDLSTEVIELRNAYIAAGIVDARSLGDATHVAAATVARADAIVSWNFRHIVRLDKIKR
jgi:predicted nucleic acid-binding protein